MATAKLFSSHFGQANIDSGFGTKRWEYTTGNPRSKYRATRSSNLIGNPTKDSTINFG